MKYKLPFFFLLVLFTACSTNQLEDPPLASEPIEEKACSEYSYADCPVDRCVVGASCPFCEDIDCFEIGYDDDWEWEL